MVILTGAADFTYKHVLRSFKILWPIYGAIRTSKNSPKVSKTIIKDHLLMETLTREKFDSLVIVEQVMHEKGVAFT